MKRTHAMALAAVLMLPGCLGSGGSPFDLIPLSEKVMMTAGGPAPQAAGSPISVEEMLARARVAGAEGTVTPGNGPVAVTIDVSDQDGALSGNTLITVGQFINQAREAGSESVVVETSSAVSPISPAAREAVQIAAMLRRAMFTVSIRPSPDLKDGKIALRNDPTATKAAGPAGQVSS